MSYKFEFYCAMTCYGGSEQKECPCSHPNDCEMQSHPDYFRQRARAMRRMVNYSDQQAKQRNKESS